MKYQVTEDCIGCGLCEGACPEVFALGEDGKAHAIEGEVPASAQSSAEEAQAGCPVSAIENI